jgi:hypothetical protein
MSNTRIAVMCSSEDCEVKLVNVIFNASEASAAIAIEQWDDSDPADICPECGGLGTPMTWEDYRNHAKDLLDKYENEHRDALDSAPHDHTEEMMLFDDHFDRVAALFQPANWD